MSPTEPTWTADDNRAPLSELMSRENFPVATRLLPVRHRVHLINVYAFARLVDDIGDEVLPDRRVEYLDLVEKDLDRIYAGATPELRPLRALARTIAARDIPAAPFHGLIQANRQDQTVSRYATFDELLAYCELSANPVGHIVLHLFGAAAPERMRLSDRVCTALQIIEHLQDIGEDYRRGRIYLPGEDMRRFGCVEEDLTAITTPTRLRGLVSFEADRASRLLTEGEPVARGLPGWGRLAVTGYLAGGRAALAVLRRGGYDVLGRRLRPGRTRLMTEWLRALGGR
ncbi:MAG TPA: squalene synthase HpnC [Thermopolyspora sp.]